MKGMGRHYRRRRDRGSLSQLLKCLALRQVYRAKSKLVLRAESKRLRSDTYHQNNSG